VLQFAMGKIEGAKACGGFVVCCQVVAWHPEFPQSVGAMPDKE
jgi:hypothetical protein